MRLCKESKTYLNDMSMLSFSNSILLRCVWAYDPVENDMSGEELFERMRGVLSTPISLEFLYFTR